MPKSLGIRCTETTLYFLPVETRVPLKFGPEILTSVTCARVRMRVVAPDGRTAEGWGETPLSVQWVWPGSLGYEERYFALEAFCRRLAHAWPEFDRDGHPLEVGYAFLEESLPGLVEEFNDLRAGSEPMPWLAALVCCSPFDVALYDAFATLHRVAVYESYSAEFLDGDLTRFLDPAEDSQYSTWRVGGFILFQGPPDEVVDERVRTPSGQHMANLVMRLVLWCDDDKHG